MNQEAKQAIERARGHLDAALRESLEASRALVEAASAAGGMGESAAGGFADEIKSALDNWIARVEDGGALSIPKAVIEPLERALQAEIARWEKRSATDETARPVLRAFLGLRELLWEMGMRGDAEDRDATRGDPDRRGAQNEAASPTHAEPSDSTPPRPGPRVQRFNLED